MRYHNNMSRVLSISRATQGFCCSLIFLLFFDQTSCGDVKWYIKMIYYCSSIKRIAGKLRVCCEQVLRYAITFVIAMIVVDDGTNVYRSYICGWLVRMIAIVLLGDQWWLVISRLKLNTLPSRFVWIFLLSNQWWHVGVQWWHVTRRL